ncbi:hypothetical protein VTG60DRAFT_4236 [Thermothelomyces hinnuleus]
MRNGGSLQDRRRHPNVVIVTIPEDTMYIYVTAVRTQEDVAMSSALCRLPGLGPEGCPQLLLECESDRIGRPTGPSDREHRAARHADARSDTLHQQLGRWSFQLRRDASGGLQHDRLGGGGGGGGGRLEDCRDVVVSGEPQERNREQKGLDAKRCDTKQHSEAITKAVRKFRSTALPQAEQQQR